MNTQVTIQTSIKAPIEKVWEYWTDPKHITKWNYASDDWHSPHAANDLRVGGRFSARMEAKDGSMGFDFGGKYEVVDTYKKIEYVMDDERGVKVTFESNGDLTTVTETFDAESENPVDMQKAGWQAILDNFKKYVEALTYPTF